MKKFKVHKRRLWVFNAIALSMLLFSVYAFFYLAASSDTVIVDDRGPMSVGVMSDMKEIFRERSSLQEIKSLIKQKIVFRAMDERKEHIVEVTIDDILRDYELSGIVAGSPNEAIIRNRRTRQTSFVMPGMKVGKLSIVAIKDDVVVCEYNGENRTLMLQ